MSADFLKKPSGLLYILQLIMGLAAGFIIQFIWEGGSVYISLIVAGHGMQTYIYLAIFVTNLAMLGVILMEVNQGGSFDSFGKLKIVIFHGICAILLFIAACMESYYVSTFSQWRYTLTMILLWLLSLSHVVQIALAFFFK